jgi:hypothetical protein
MTNQNNKFRFCWGIVCLKRIDECVVSDQSAAEAAARCEEGSHLPAGLWALPLYLLFSLSNTHSLSLSLSHTPFFAHTLCLSQTLSQTPSLSHTPFAATRVWQRRDEEVMAPTKVRHAEATHLSHTHKVFLKSFCRSQHPRKFVDLSSTIANIKNQLTDLSGN